MLSLLAGLDVDVRRWRKGLSFPLRVRLLHRGAVRRLLRAGDGDAGDDLPGVRNRHGGVAGPARGRGEVGPELRARRMQPRALHADRPERLHRRRDGVSVIRSAAFLGKRRRGRCRTPSSGLGHGDGDARLRRGGGPGGSTGLVSSTRSRTRSSRRCGSPRRCGSGFPPSGSTRRGRVAATSGGSFRKCGGSSICAASGMCA